MESIYRVEGAVAHTSALAGGPWDPKLQHGAAPATQICWAVERLPSPVPMRVVRLTVDLMRPVPVAPLTIESKVLREGRKIQLVSVRLLANGTKVVRATALRVPHLDQALPSAAYCPPIDMRGPEVGRDPATAGMARTPFLSGISMRMARGSFRLPGPAAV
jgi:Thioesterase-like superfamily